jgi:hypothetical protein
MVLINGLECVLQVEPLTNAFLYLAVQALLDCIVLRSERLLQVLRFAIVEPVLRYHRYFELPLLLGCEGLTGLCGNILILLLRSNGCRKLVSKIISFHDIVQDILRILLGIGDTPTQLACLLLFDQVLVPDQVFDIVGGVVHRNEAKREVIGLRHQETVDPRDLLGERPSVLIEILL